jgi:hypothetical protein
VYILFFNFGMIIYFNEDIIKCCERLYRAVSNLALAVAVAIYKPNIQPSKQPTYTSSQLQPHKHPPHTTAITGSGSGSGSGSVKSGSGSGSGPIPHKPHQPLIIRTPGPGQPNTRLRTPENNAKCGFAEISEIFYSKFLIFISKLGI